MSSQRCSNFYSLEGTGFGQIEEVDEMWCLPVSSLLPPSCQICLHIELAWGGYKVLIPGSCSWRFLFHWCGIWPGHQDFLEPPQRVLIYSEGEQNMAHPNMLLWHKDHFEPFILRNSRHRIISKNRSYSFVKSYTLIIRMSPSQYQEMFASARENVCRAIITGNTGIPNPNVPSHS